MAWRSPRLVPVLAAVALLALLGAGCGSDDEATSDAPPSSLLATAASKQIDSAEVSVRAAADIPGFPILGDRLSMTASGPIAMDSSGKPELDWDAMLRAGGQAFPARLTAVDGRFYVDFQGLSYEADPELVEMLPFKGKPRRMSLESLGIDPADWLKSTRVEDGAEIGGDSTQVVTGTVDKQAVLDDVSGLDLPQLDEKDLDRVADAIEDVEVEVNVDDDGYPRRVFASLRFELPKGIENAAYEGGEISFELVFEKIGDVRVDVLPPANPRPLSDLFDFAGVIFGIDEPSDLWTSPL